ncbi:MAG: Ribose-5-phosphate isomerase A [Chloroflexi bacterium ADurb.Bin325]|nr:MAG: Ribose-5-phosphate isomerase A [Chloroflexi bacterium ADurb.Bin325]
MGGAPQQSLKQQAADQVLTYIRPGMIVGLGAGSTALLAVRGLAARLARGELADIKGIPCSRAIEAEARALGIPLTTLEEEQADADGRVIDFTFDGADEVDPALNLIKGGGGALLHEKIVAQASRREVIIVDESKLSPTLGVRWAVPVEVVPFGWRTQAAYLESLGGRPRLRPGDDGRPYVTDQGNLILDSAFGPIDDPARLAARLDARTGIVCHGLFLQLADEVIVAGAAGLRRLTRPDRP